MRSMTINTILCFSITLFITAIQGHPDMDRLFQYVGNKTNHLSIPLPAHGGPLPVTLSTLFITIFDVDEIHQTLTSNIWFFMQWTDDRLTWNPVEFGNISLISLPAHMIWTPHVEIFNTADDNPMLHSGSLSSDEIECQLRPDGGVLWASQRRASSTCAIDVYYYPFDSQSCELRILSHTLPNSYINWTVNPPTDATTGTWKSYSGWEITSLNHSVLQIKDNISGTKVPLIGLHINIRRLFSFFSLAILVPSALLTALTLGMFWVPPQSTDKMSMGMAIWTCLCVSLLVLVGIIPGGSGIMPLVGTFFILSLAFVTISMIITIGTTRMAENCTPVPGWLSKVGNNILAPLLCMCGGRTFKTRTYPSAILVVESTEKNLNTDSNEAICATAEEDRRKYKEEWQYIASIFDRFFFWIFFIGIIIFCVWIIVDFGKGLDISNAK